MDDKNTNKMLASRSQYHIKKIIPHDQVWLIPGKQSWFNIWKSINIIHLFTDPGRHHIITVSPHHIITSYNYRHHIITDAVKALEQNSEHIPDQNYSMDLKDGFFCCCC